jgi:NADH-quinone oxidoreductase subunit I
MFGTGIIKGLVVTIKEFIETYVDDLKKIPSRYRGGRGVIDQTQNLAEQSGLFTIQYPEERRKLPERFRYIPMLIYQAETGEDLCTACGICAKVCPPQCIWIVRDKDEKGKPVTRPAEFWIDASICMNCGLCAEYCPFDAIKMNHDFEITAYERMPHLVYGLKELRVPHTYYAKIRPTDYAAEEACRADEAARKAAARAPGARTAATAAAARPAATPATPPPALAPATDSASGEAAIVPTDAASVAPSPAAPGPRKLSPEEMERVKAEAAARRAAKAAAAGAEAGAEGAETPAAAQTPTASAGPRKLSPEEVEHMRAEAAAKRAAKAAQESASSASAEAPASAEAATPSEAPASATTDAAAQTPAADQAAPLAGPRKLSPEEVARLRAEAAAKRAAKAAADAGSPKPDGDN